MKLLDLFSGIGGFSLGLERAGMRTIAFCEIEPFCQKVLRKHWPDVPIFSDIRELKAYDLPEQPDVICGGFPCQPFSFAGYRKGGSDPRDMAPEMLRIIRENKPTWVIGENVKGFIDIGLDSFCHELENNGYSVRPIGIPACAVGLPTMEWHLWIVATTSGERLQGFWEDAVQKIELQSKKFQGSDSRGLERWNLSSSRVCRVGERIPRRVDRLRALGNAVVPQIPEIIGRAIMEIT